MKLTERAKALWKLFTKGGMTTTDKIILVVALLYCLSPVDIIPDAIPVVGFLDDLLVVLLTLRSVTNGKDGRRKGGAPGKDDGDNAKEVDAKVL